MTFLVDQRDVRVWRFSIENIKYYISLCIYMIKTIITLLTVLLFLIVLILKIISYSLSRKVYTSMQKTSSATFNLKTMSLSDEEISKFPKQLQEDIRKKRTIDKYFFISFIILVILIILRFIF